MVINDPEAVPAGLSEVDPCTRAWLHFLRRESLSNESRLFQDRSSGGSFPDIWEASATQCERSARERIQAELVAEGAKEYSESPQSPAERAEADHSSDSPAIRQADLQRAKQMTATGSAAAANELMLAAVRTAQAASKLQIFSDSDESLPPGLTGMSGAFEGMSLISEAARASDSVAQVLDALGAEMNGLLLPLTSAMEAAHWVGAGDAGDLGKALEALRSTLTDAVQPLAFLDLQAIEGITSSCTAIQALADMSPDWGEIDDSHFGIAGSVAAAIEASNPEPAPSRGKGLPLREPVVEGRPYKDLFAREDPERSKWAAMSRLVSQLLVPLNSNLLDRMPAEDATSEAIRDWTLDLCAGVFDCRATMLAVGMGTERGADARERRLREFENSILNIVAENCLTFIPRPMLQMRLGERREYWMEVAAKLVREAEKKNEEADMSPDLSRGETALPRSDGSKHLTPIATGREVWHRSNPLIKRGFGNELVVDIRLPRLMYEFHPAFPEPVRAGIIAERLRAEDAFFEKKCSIREFEAAEALLLGLVLRVFVAFAVEGFELGARMDLTIEGYESECLRFLRSYVEQAGLLDNWLLPASAHAELPDSIQSKIEHSEEYRRYRRLLQVLADLKAEGSRGIAGVDRVSESPTSSEIGKVTAPRRHGFEADMDRHRAIAAIVSRHAPDWRENPASWKKAEVLTSICGHLDTAMSSDPSGLYEVPGNWRTGKTESLKGTPAKGWSEALTFASRKLVSDQIGNSLSMVRKREERELKHQRDQANQSDPVE